MRIVVYDVAASSGGALSILESYYNAAQAQSDNDYLFILSTPSLSPCANVAVSRHPDIKRSWLNRVWFELFIARRIIRQFGAQSVVSLQNLRVPFVSIHQTVYMHNLLPRQLCDLRFSIRRDPKMWVRQNIIGSMIIRSLRRADLVIVQAGWIADRLQSRCGIEAERIQVHRPVLAPCVSAEIRSVAIVGRQKFLYPASAAPFKNHRLILAACMILKDRGVDNYQVTFTLDGTEASGIAAIRAETRRLHLPIVWLGWLSKEELQREYASSTSLLFPSLLETIGLPLLEAQQHGLMILAADREYVKEAVGIYPSVTLFDPSDPTALANEMANLISRGERS